MLIHLKKLFGPIRRCHEVAPNAFVCVVRTPGFTKDTLQWKITDNDLFMIDGDTILTENSVPIHRSRIHEAIQLPLRVKKDTIRWDTRDGLTIVYCENNST